MYGVCSGTDFNTCVLHNAHLPANAVFRKDGYSYTCKIVISFLTNVAVISFLTDPPRLAASHTASHDGLAYLLYPAHCRLPNDEGCLGGE